MKPTPFTDMDYSGYGIGYESPAEEEQDVIREREMREE
jgi:hypothetical protein